MDIPHVSRNKFTFQFYNVPINSLRQTLDSLYDETVLRALEEIPQLQSIESNEVLFIAIMSDPSHSVRDAFKRWGDIIRGVPTQVCISHLLSFQMLIVIGYHRLSSDARR